MGSVKKLDFNILCLTIFLQLENLDSRYHLNDLNLLYVILYQREKVINSIELNKN